MENALILLGSYDNAVTQAERDAYLRQATAISGGRGDQAAEGSDKFSFAPYTPEPQQPIQGSTDPGATSNPAGALLVQGQHEYHFGWHKSQHLALRPTDRGVLVVRSKGDFRLDDADVSKGLEANSTIHIHWGGKGLTFDVNNWSEGCQVLNGSAYVGPNNERIDCSSFVATNNSEVASNPSKTRGAYNLVADPVLGLGNDLPGNAVLYTLLTEQDVSLTSSPTIADGRMKADVLLA